MKIEKIEKNKFGSRVARPHRDTAEDIQWEDMPRNETETKNKN